ncbi:MAG: hypothetical protein HYT76_01420 [Deltaproteobacteria bacterium]|nr:hypothetical protein [Deltaproteobacteria bacterium]
MTVRTPLDSHFKERFPGDDYTFHTAGLEPRLDVLHRQDPESSTFLYLSTAATVTALTYLLLRRKGAGSVLEGTRYFAKAFRQECGLSPSITKSIVPGTESARIDKLLDTLLDESPSYDSLLEAIRGGSTREEIASAIRKSGGVPDEKFLGGLLTNSAKRRVIEEASGRETVKEALRPILLEWHRTAFSEIADVAARADRRVARQVLNRAMTLVDGEGDEFCDELLGLLSPGERAALDGAQIGRAIEMWKRESRRELVGQLKQALHYKPEKGVLDALCRPLNAAYDFTARPIDRGIARGLESIGQDFADLGAVSLDQHPLLWLKRFRRHLYLASQSESVRKRADKPLGPFLRKILQATEFLSQRFGTEEFRLAHRPFFWIGLGLFKLSDEDSTTHEVGMVSMIIGTNYYVQKLGIGQTYAMDIIMIQKLIQTGISKWDADSDDLLDIQRTVGAYEDVVLSLFIQSYWTYGLNYAERSPLGQIIGHIPFLRRLPFSMNGQPFFGFYRGGLAKPDFLRGAGVWGGIKGLGFATCISAVMSYGIGLLFKDERLFNASEDYALQKAVYYGLNGAFTNVPGFLISAYLEPRSAGGALGTTFRQFVERVLGIGTNYLSLQVTDIFAGKGDYKGKENRLLAEAARGSRESAREAWDVFVDRCSYDFGGLWYRYNFFWPPAPEPGRTPGFHLGPTYHTLQRKSWYSESPMEFSDEKEHQGYFVELAKNHPKRLAAFLAEFERQLGAEDAEWRTSRWTWDREKQQKSIYHFSLMVKSFAYRSKDHAEYKPFADFLARSSFKDYWDQIELCETDTKLEKAIIRLEDLKKIRTPADKNLGLVELFSKLEHPEAT